MGYGEASIKELLADYKQRLAESEAVLGVRVLHISPPTHEIVRDRLGGVKKIEKVSEPDYIRCGSVEFSPTEEFLKRVGIQEKVDCVLIMSLSNVPENFDKINSRFILETSFRGSQEYKIKDTREFGHVGNEFIYLAIGLVTK